MKISVLGKTIAADGTIEVPGVQPIPAAPVTSQSYPFRPNSWIYKKAGASLDPNSKEIIADLVGQSKPTSAGGSVWAYPNIALNEFSVPIFHVTTDIPKKTLVYSKNHSKSVSIRVPANIYSALGSDKHCMIFDWIDKTFVDMWLFDPATLTAVHGGMISDFVSSDGTFTYPMGARACGIAAQAGVITLESLAKGLHQGVVAIAAARTNLTPKWPANRVDSYAQNNTLVRMGQIVALPANYIVPPNLPPILKIIATAARDYGMVIVDTTAGSCINMGYIEDPRPRGKTVNDVISAYFGGLQAWQLGQMFPWSALVALS